jgi:putative hemolysin
MKTIRDKDFLHHEFHVLARPKYSCGLPERENDPDLGDGIFLPRLFSTYMRLGGKVVSEPAIDREFGTVDFLVLLDAANVQMSSMEISK